VEGSPAHHLRSLAAGYYGALLLGGLGIALLSTLLGLTRLPRRVGSRLAGRARDLLLAPRATAFAVAAGAAAGLLTLLLAGFAFSFRPVLLDATSQLVHARYLASGRLAGPELALPEFFLFQFMVNLPVGWASQYPPGHIALLAVGFGMGAPWVVGPLLAAATVTLTARVAEDLLPDDRLAARLGTVLLASSLFFLGHAAGYMNHATAAAFGTLAVLGGLRGRAAGTAGRVWLVAAGLATGMTFATRPVAGITVGAVVLTSLLLAQGGEPIRARLRRVVRRLPLLAAGGLPPLAAVGAYNRHLFGSPTRFGYVAAEGPGHAMGFHRDPWGDMYGPLDGLVQTSRDLLALGLDLLVTPLSAVVVIAAYLLLGPARSRALPVLLLWALLPVVGHFFYWHQDLFMGPRLLTEFAPPWAILTALAVLGLVRRTRGLATRGSGRLDLHGAVGSAFLLAGVAAVALLIPQRVALYASQWGGAARAPVPAVREPSLVFVQGQWTERLGARLAAHGLRVDSVRAALRYNSSCEVQEFLDAREARRAGAPGPAPTGEPAGLRFQPRPGVGIVEVRLDRSVTVRTYVGEEPTPACLRQMNADRRGAVEFPELLWQGDLPGLGRTGALFARDLGPALNARLQALHPERRPLVYLRPEPHLAPVLLPYAEGMAVLWELPGDRSDGGGAPAG
jgi:hypothetical protein